MAGLCVVTQSLPIGTNLALLHFLWMLLWLLVVQSWSTVPGVERDRIETSSCLTGVGSFVVQCLGDLHSTGYLATTRRETAALARSST
jgi:hypothetical protein